MEKENEISEPNADCKEASVSSDPEKIADKPHRFTLVVSFVALILSFCGLVTSGFSAYYTSLGVQVGQRAYLSVTPSFPIYEDDSKASENDVLSLPASIEIKNLGNTPAYAVRLNVDPSNATSGYQFHLEDQTIPAIGPKDSVRISFNVIGSRKLYRNGQSFPGAALQLCSIARYDDVFGSHQSDRSCFGPSFKITMRLNNPPRPMASPAP